MKIRFCLLLSLCISITSLSAQQIEIFGGINSNHFFDSNDDSEFKSGNGYTIGFSFDNPNMNGIASRITLSYNNIKGNVLTSETKSPGVSKSTTVALEKESFNLTVYPFTFIIQNIYVSFGLQGNFTMSNNSLGMFETNEPGYTLFGELNLNETEFHKEISYGAAVRIHYNIMLNNGLSIIPQYNLYYGIGEEYSTAESEKIKVWQQVMAIGIGMQF